MEVKELFGLPAHPLIVHAVVVLLPLAAIGVVLCALVPAWRGPYAPLVLVAAVVATVAVLFAQGSGEELEDDVDETELVEDHAEKGEQVLPWAIGVTVAAAAVAAAPRFHRRRPGASTSTVTAIVTVVSLAAAAGAVYSVIESGHSGAKAAWDDVDDRGARDGG